MQNTKRIAIDPGRRFVKATRIDNMDTVTISSVAGVGDTDIGQLSLGDIAHQASPKPEPCQVVVNGTSYLVGAGTSRYTEPIEGLYLLWAHNGPQVRALLYGTLHNLLGPGQHGVELHIVVPTPTDIHLEKFRDWAGGQHSSEIDGEEMTLNIVGVQGYPAGLGAYYAWGLNDKGEWEDPALMRGQVAIVDIGHFETKLSVIIGGDLDKEVKGTPGISLITNALRDELENHYDMTYELFRADQMLYADRPVTIHTPTGEEDITYLIETSAQIQRTHLLSFAQARGLDQYDRVVLTGGGVNLFAEDPPNIHRRTSVLDEPITATVRGLAQYIARDKGRAI